MKLKYGYWNLMTEQPNFSIDHFFVEEEGDVEKVKSCFGGYAADWMTDLPKLYRTLVDMRCSKKRARKYLYRLVMESLETKLPLLAKVINLDVERKLRSLQRVQLKVSNELYISDMEDIYLEED